MTRLRRSGSAIATSTCRSSRRCPGLRGTKVSNVSRRYAGEDFVATCEMYFDDADALKAAMRSDEMRVAGDNLSEFATGLLTLVASSE